MGDYEGVVHISTAILAAMLRPGAGGFVAGGRFHHFWSIWDRLGFYYQCGAAV